MVIGFEVGSNYIYLGVFKHDDYPDLDKLSNSTRKTRNRTLKRLAYSAEGVRSSPNDANEGRARTWARWT